MEITIEKIIIRYLEGNATPSEKHVLSSWLKESKEHEEVFLMHYDIWALTHQSTFNPETALEKVYSSQQTSNKPYKRIIIWSITAAACIAILFGIKVITDLDHSQPQNIRQFANNQKAKTDHSEEEDIRLVLSEKKQVKVKNRKEALISYLDSEIEIDEEQTVSKKEAAEFNQLITPYGKRSTLVLEDGTKIWLNANSRLVYPAQFAHTNREIYVEGEIFLEVAPDKNRPFIVKTDRINVEVLGTSFSISEYGREASSRVILASGKVDVYAEGKGKEKIKLKPNEMYELSVNGEVKIDYVPDVAIYTSWIDGIYQFNHESLSTLLKLMERYYGEKIVFAPEVGNLTCSGKLRLNDDFQSMLQGLTETLPIEFENRNNTYYINKSHPN